MDKILPLLIAITLALNLFLNKRPAAALAVGLLHLLVVACLNHIHHVSESLSPPSCL
ncbi:hypothetical protein YC2023_027823 [Brassica napus]